MNKIEKKSIFEHFIDGARNGWAIFQKNMLPAIVMAYILIHIINVTGLTEIVSVWFDPVMAIFALPGIAVTAIIAGFFSKGGGCAAAALLAMEGQITFEHATMLLPAIILFGGLLQQWVRIVITAGVPDERQGWMFLIALGESVIALYVMRVLLLFIQ